MFPDKLNDEDRPEGWKQGNLADVAVSPRRGVNPADVAEGTPYIGLEHMPRGSISLAKWESAKKVMSNKTVFKGENPCSENWGPYFHKVGVAVLDGICSTDIIVVTLRAPQWAGFTLVCLSSSELMNYTTQTSTGTKMPRTSWKTMGQYRGCLPSERITCAFQSVVQPLMEWLGTNIHENRALT